MKGINIFKLLFYIVLPAFLVSFLLWYFQEKKPLRVYILDKTVLDYKYTEHKSFNWILNYHRFVKPGGVSYSVSKDYYGFIPTKLTQPKEYKVRSLRLYEVLSFSDDIDLVYYTDAYGITYEDWYNRPPEHLHSSLLYGGINQNDYLLLLEMRRKNKLIITEFNMLGAPTSDLIRNKTENLFDFYWTGWTGCYFKSLNQINPNLPKWIIQLYEEKYKKDWQFNGQGLILVNESGDIVVLENKVHLKYPCPQIIPTAQGKEKYKLPEYQNYSFWFDIINPGKINTIIANYNLNLTAEGKKLLNDAAIPSSFPAVIAHTDNYKFYYFAGDFSDRKIFYASSRFKGTSYVSKILSLKSSTSRNAFFWRFYVPLVENILKNNVPY